MARPGTGRPTDFELEVLKILWECGPSTVREVHEVLAAEREIGLTTVLKMMQVMRDKGLLKCDSDQRPQKFRPAQSQPVVLRQLAGDLLQRAFGGSPEMFLQHALAGKSCSPEELAAIRQLIEQHAQRGKP